MKQKFMRFLSGLAEGMIAGFFMIQTENIIQIGFDLGKFDI